MKNIIVGLIIGVIFSIACGIVFYPAAASKALNKNDCLIDKLYYDEPREGSLTEWICSVDELSVKDRALARAKLEKCTETFMLAYLGVSATNQQDYVRMMKKYIPINKVLK